MSVTMADIFGAVMETSKQRIYGYVQRKHFGDLSSCHIDTLSDIAMLAIDIEARLLHEHKDEKRARAISTLLLNSYLGEVQENSERSWSLLEYYMVEKAIVCAYVSILFDNMPDMGKEYLKVALYHANRLKNLQDPVKKVLVSEEEAGAVHSYSN